MNLYAYAGNNPIAFSDPFGLSACPGVDGTDQERIDDCPERSPEYFAARLAKGEGNQLVNQVLGVVATMGQTLAEHVALSGTLGLRTVSADGYALTGPLTGTSDQTHVTTSWNALPQVGASADIIFGDPASSPTDASHIVGVGRHLGITITYAPERAPGLSTFKSVTLSIGATIPGSPINAAGNYHEVR